MQQLNHARGISGVYTITNRTNGLVYVGSASNVGDRWYTHRGRLRRGLHSNPRFQAAWDESGEDAFHFLLVEDISELSDLRAREQVWLDAKQAADPTHGYNLMANARAVGFKFSDEQKARVSAALKGRKKSPEHCAAMSASMRSRTPEQKAVARERMAALGRLGKGVKKKKAHLRKIGLAQRGSKNHMSKLTETDVIEIHWHLAIGEKSKYEIADLYGIAYGTVYGIATGKSWGYLKPK